MKEAPTRTLTRPQPRVAPALRPGPEAGQEAIPIVGLWSDDPVVRQAVPEALAPTVAVVPLGPASTLPRGPAPEPPRVQALLLDAAWLDHPALQSLWPETRRPPVLVLLRAEQLEGASPVPPLSHDFVVWPCQPGELRLRVRGLLDRARSRPEPIVCGPIAIDPERLEVRLAGRPVHLTPKEFRVLQELARRCDCPVHRHDLLNAAWGWETDSNSNVVDAVVRNLRKKLEPDPARPRYILTVRGVGYKLASAPASAADPVNPGRPGTPTTTAGSGTGRSSPAPWTG